MAVWRADNRRGPAACARQRGRRAPTLGRRAGGRSVVLVKINAAHARLRRERHEGRICFGHLPAA